MVLAYWGDLHSEAELATLLGSKAYGTPLSNVARLHVWGYDASLVTLTRPSLEALLDAGMPVIARVWTVMLDYWLVETSHVVLVVGYDENAVFLNDPAFADQMHAVVWDAFLAAWAEFDETAAIIRPAE
jgi:ABC-type bacteriocin/lantibiotic exporter with double-glycine peptidase domain